MQTYITKIIIADSRNFPQEENCLSLSSIFLRYELVGPRNNYMRQHHKITNMHTQTVIWLLEESRNGRKEKVNKGWVTWWHAGVHVGESLQNYLNAGV